MNKIIFIVALCVLASQIECGPVVRRLDLKNSENLRRANELAEYALNIQSFKDQKAYVLEEVLSYSTQYIYMGNKGHRHSLSLRVLNSSHSIMLHHLKRAKYRELWRRQRLLNSENRQ